jgi:hypothetical protein
MWLDWASTIRNHFAAPVTLLTLFLLVTGIPLVTVAC